MEASMEMSAQRRVLNPLAPLGRSWRSLRRRPLAMQLRTAAIVIAIVVALVAWLMLAPSGTPGGAGSAGAAEVASAVTTGGTPVSAASTSTRGVSGNTINVVFPVVAVNSEAGRFGFSTDKEFNEQTAAINLYVNQINHSGGVNGRKINPMIVSFDPANNANMQSLCQQWTQGNPAVFAIVDGIGTWTGDNQLCVTEQGHTPLISAWSTTTNWTQMGSPYLWWTGPDQSPVLAATVQWGLSSGRLGHGKKVGVVVSDQAGDQAALNSYLLPDLKAAGITAPGRHRRRQPGPVGQHQLAGATRRGALQGCGRAIRLPAVTGERVLSLPGGRERAAVLPATADERLPVHHRGRARPDSRALRGRAERPGGRHDRDPRWFRRRPAPEPGRLRPGGALVLPDVALRTTRSPSPAQRAITSRSRDPFRPGAAPSGCSQRRPRTRGPT